MLKGRPSNVEPPATQNYPQITQMNTDPHRISICVICGFVLCRWEGAYLLFLVFGRWLANLSPTTDRCSGFGFVSAAPDRANRQSAIA